MIFSIYVLATTILVAVILYHYWCVKWSRSAKLVNLIPGPSMVPLFGNALLFAVSMEKLWNVRRQLNTKYYPIWRFWTYSMSVINIFHPDDIEILMSSTKHTYKAYTYKLLHPWLGYGLLTSEGGLWQTRRKTLTPTFHFKILQEFLGTFDEEAKYMCQRLAQRKNDDLVVKDLLSFISYHTLNTICETAIGTTLKDKGELQTNYRKAVHDIGQIMIYRLSRPWFYIDTIFNIFPKGWDQKTKLNILHGFTNEIITERKKHQQKNDQSDKHENMNSNANNTNEEIIGQKRKLAMLDLLLNAHKENNYISDIGIREEVDTFVFAGHDTTALAICFVLMCLAEHKEIQERVRAEVKAVLLANDDKITLSNLQDMQYLERCIKESLRLHPSVPFVGRRLLEDLQLKNYLVPANSEIHVHIYDVHRDPNFWPNPEVFDPDRFLPENCQGRHPFCYIPFSAGPRNCIGQKFAMQQIKTMLAHLLISFYIEPIDRLKDMRMRTDLVYRPAHPLHLKFVPIN